MISKADLKLINALKLKKYRTKERKFLVEGIKSVNELLDSDFKVVRLFVSEEARQKVLSTTSVTVSKSMIKKASSLANNEDCLAIVEMLDPVEPSIDHDKAMIALDGIQDPGNLGTIVRTLDWFGFERLFCSEDCVDFYNPKVIVSSMGSFTRVKPHYVDLVSLFTQYDYHVYGLTMDGKSIVKEELNIPAFYVLGSESSGIRPELSKLITQTISIPGSGKAESLNVSIAAGILMSQLFKY